MRLDVDRIVNAERIAEKLLGACNRQALDVVNILAPAVIALAGIAFGVLVREARALRSHNSRRGIVFARNELNMIFLTTRLGVDGLPNRRILCANVLL